MPPPRPLLDEYPFAARYFARPDGLALHYVDEGRGPPVVLVHGNPTWSFFYRRLIAGLAPDFRCLALDHLGMGYSDRPGADRYGFRLADRVADFTAWLAGLALSEPIHLVVHDWGGPIGLGWAVTAPERVASLTVMNTALRRPPGYRPPWRLGLFRLAPTLGDFLARRLNRFARGTAFFGPVRPLSPEARAGFLAPYGSPEDRLALARFIADIPLDPAHPSFDSLRLIDRRFDEVLYSKPLALVWGLRDFVFDRRIFLDWRERRPQAETLVLPEAGHYLLEDEPDRILKFLSAFYFKNAGAETGGRSRNAEITSTLGANSGGRCVGAETGGRRRNAEINSALGAFNIASLLVEAARRWPERLAVVSPHRPDVLGRGQLTYRELDESSSRLAAWLLDQGPPRGSRLAVLVRPGADFVTVIFGLFKAGLVPVLADPGLGAARLFHCLAEGRPAGLVGLPLAHLASLAAFGLSKSLRLRITVGRRWGWGGATLAAILKRPSGQPELPVPTKADDMAALLFTSGSTGPAKGVVYTHAMFAAQVEAIREGLDIRPGGRDLATFPLFGLFAPALGLTSITPDFNPARPARADPRAVIEPIIKHKITSLFASPTLLAKVAAQAQERGLTLPSLQRVISAGAPVPPRALASFRPLLSSGALLQTPYGATEGLPLTSIDDGEILSRTRALTEAGQGLCVGRPLPGVSLAVIRITEEILPELSPDLLLPPGEIGEIIARGPMVSPGYFDRPEDTARSVIPESDPAGKDTRHAVSLDLGLDKCKKFWRRMGDVGWLDEEGRLWFCGRKAHRVTTGRGVLFSVPCEAVFNNHPKVRRSALVGVGPPEDRKPVIIVELNSRLRRSAWRGLAGELAALARANPRTQSIEIFLRHPAFPVDPRHNAKINREALAAWAEGELDFRR